MIKNVSTLPGGRRGKFETVGEDKVYHTTKWPHGDTIEKRYTI